MRDEAGRKPTMKDMFPDVKEARVGKLLEDPDLIAFAALADLACQINLIEELGTDKAKLNKLIQRVYSPAMTALKDKLISQGWSITEIGAAARFSEGNLDN